MRFITTADYLLLPFYLLAIFSIAYTVRNRLYPEGHAWRAYFIPALIAKISGAVFISLIYQYYYGGGDTSNYFYQSLTINSAFSESPAKWVKLLFRVPAWYEGDFIMYTSKLFWYRDPASYAIVSITAFFNVFTFNTFLPTSILFASLSFTGVWAMFRTFALQYPGLTKPIAVAILFIPSTLIWGSGIFKDTVCMFALGWLIYSVFQLLIQRKFSLFNIIMLLLSFYLLALVKIYILVAFIPALALWIMFMNSHRIKSRILKLGIRLLIPVCAFAGFGYFFSRMEDTLGRYSIDNLAQTSYMTREWISISSGDEGSAYDLGDFEPTVAGMVRKFPQAVNVTLFRPYLWEAKKAIVFINALESFIFLLLTLKILLTVGPVRIWKAVSRDPNIQFCLIFTIIFAFAVGISSYNFGTLSRYKIPCMPLFALSLVLIHHRYAPPGRSVFSLRRG